MKTSNDFLMGDSIADKIHRTAVLDRALELNRQRKRERDSIIQEVYAIFMDEQKVKAKLAACVPFSDKWWLWLGRMNTLRNDLLSGLEMTDQIDPSVSRAILFGG